MARLGAWEGRGVSQEREKKRMWKYRRDINQKAWEHGGNKMMWKETKVLFKNFKTSTETPLPIDPVDSFWLPFLFSAKIDQKKLIIRFLEKKKKFDLGPRRGKLIVFVQLVTRLLSVEENDVMIYFFLPQ